MRSHCSGADGVVGIDELLRIAFLKKVPFPTTPSAPLKEASRHLLDVASTPPMSGGEWRPNSFFIDSDYRNYLGRQHRRNVWLDFRNYHIRSHAAGAAETRPRLSSRRANSSAPTVSTSQPIARRKASQASIRKT